MTTCHQSMRVRDTVSRYLSSVRSCVYASAMTVATQRTKRRQNREETRNQILAAGEEFLRERSYRELSVDAIMTRTGHSRTVFYRHFDDVPSLVLALIQRVGGE